MKAKKIIERILKTIQIILNMVMSVTALAVSVSALNKSYYIYSDWFAYATFWLLGLVVFNGLIIYIRRLVNNY